MADQDYPTFNDGRRAPRQPTLKCWNYPGAGVATDLIWLEDDIKASAYSVDHMNDATGEKLGGFSGASVRAGTISAQLDDAATAGNFLPAYVLSLLKGAITNWYVATEVSPPFKGKEAVRLGFSVSRIINPFFSTFLSADEGDTYRKTYSIATMASTETLNGTPVNTRTGATLATAIAALGTTTTFPGITMHATTGVISIVKASVTAGVYELDATVTDTLANKRTLVGGNRVIITITA